MCALGVALCLMVLCSALRVAVGAQAAATGTIGGKVSVVSHPARRLATAGVYPGRIVGIQPERKTSELDNVIVFVDAPAVSDRPPQRATIRQTNEEFVPHVIAVTAGSTVDFPNDDP